MPRRTDTVTPQKRSEIMRAVRSRGNKVTELVLVRLLRNHKVTGWQRHTAVVGSPDFVFPKQKLALFVDGCFWHGCGLHCRMPKGNRVYWNGKIAGNKARDRKVNRALRAAGWRMVRIWEHELPKRGMRNAERGTGKRQRGTRNAECGIARIRKALAAASEDRGRERTHRPQNRATFNSQL